MRHCGFLFLFTIFLASPFNAAQAQNDGSNTQPLTCGLKGSIEDRIQDCEVAAGAKKEGFLLVTRIDQYNEVYQEISTRRVWSSRLLEVGFSDAESACNPESWNSKKFGNLQKVKWRLPSVEDYKSAVKSGIISALSDMKSRFWTNDFNYIFQGGNSGLHTSGVLYNDLKQPFKELSLRCIGEID